MPSVHMQPTPAPLSTNSPFGSVLCGQAQAGCSVASGNGSDHYKLLVTTEAVPYPSRQLLLPKEAQTGGQGSTPAKSGREEWTFVAKRQQGILAGNKAKSNRRLPCT